MIGNSVKLFLILFFSVATSLSSQSTSLVGSITNLKTNKPIPFVNIGVEGTYYGTSSNENGLFKLVLQNGLHELIVSCVGFEKKTINITIPHENRLSIVLNPIPIELPEIIVDADENPAYAIIRKAISNKEKNKHGLLNYHYNFYSKNILRSGTVIVFIEEDIGDGIKILPDSVKELKTRLSKTANISQGAFSNTDLNFFEKEIIDFTDDSLTLGKFVFHLPLSKFAFDYYDYELLGVQQGDDRNYYQIKVLPYSKIRPTFAGEVLIEDSAYALTGLNLTLENRNLMPFTDFKMSIIQNLLKYKNYWFPKYYNIDVETNMNYYHLIKLDSAITSFVKVFNNIKINLTDDHSLLQNLIQVGDSAFKHEPNLITKNAMDSLRLYPLVLEETEAYYFIDSTKDIVSSLKLGGIGGEYIKSNINSEYEPDSSFNFWKLLDYVDIRNNRVDGLCLGLKTSGWIDKKYLNYKINTGYSFARKDVDSRIELFVPIKTSTIDEYGFKANYGTLPIGTFTPYSELFNAISVTLGFEDQYNYYFSRGLSFGITKNISKETNIKFDVNVESQKSIDEKKYYNIFNSKRSLRENLKIAEGMDNRVNLLFKVGSSPYVFDVGTNDGFISKMEFSSKTFDSDFDYLKINLASQVFTKTIFDELFFSPYLAFYLEASAVVGNYGPQHLITPQTAMGVYSPLGTFKGLLPYQLLGDKSISLHIEHNWRKTFFDMLGIYFPIAWNLELSTGISGLAIWNNSDFLSDQFKDEYYWEVYGGFSGILGLINVNVAYNRYRDITVRFGFSKLF